MKQWLQKNKTDLFSKSALKLLKAFFLQIRLSRFICQPRETEHILDMGNLRRCRMKFQSSDDEQVWCLVSCLLLKNPCLNAISCQSRSLTVLTLTLVPMVCKETGIAENQQKLSAELNDILYYSVTCCGCVTGSSRGEVSQNGDRHGGVYEPKVCY